MGSLFGNIARGIGKIGMTAVRSGALKAIPAVGTALSVASLGTSLLSGSKGGGMPALPGMPMSAGAISPLAGQRGLFSNDPNVSIEMIKASAISKGNLRMYYRSPAKGYVIVKDEVGDPMAIPKYLAKKFYGWKPAKKPLLSVRDTNAIRRAGVAIKKLQGAEKMAKRIANWKSPTRSKQVFITGGVVGKKRAA